MLIEANNMNHPLIKRLRELESFPGLVPADLMHADFRSDPETAAAAAQPAATQVCYAAYNYRCSHTQTSHRIISKMLRSVL